MRRHLIATSLLTVLMTLPLQAQSAKSRPLHDASGEPTGLAVPALEGEAALEDIARKQDWKRPHMDRYFALLQTEANPDTRRHLLFELSFATGDRARAILSALTAMTHDEPEEQVRKAIIASLSALAIQGGLPEADILQALRTIQRMMREDPSWNVRVHAARTLVLYGDGEAEAILLEALETNRELELSELEAIPITLQRLDTETSRAALLALLDGTPHDTVELGALWGAYELGLIDQGDVLPRAEALARDSRELRARVRAVSVLRLLASQSPLLQEQIQETIRELRESESDERTRQQLELLERRSTEGGCDDR